MERESFGKMVSKETLLSSMVNFSPVDKGSYVACQCPKCGKNDAFFYYSAGFFARITCNHRESCGFSGKIWDHCQRPEGIKTESLLQTERQYFNRHGINLDALVASGYIGSLGQLVLSVDSSTGKEWRKELKPKDGKLRWMLPKGWKKEMGEWYPVLHVGDQKRLYVLEGDADWLKGVEDGLTCTASLFGARGKVDTDRGKAVFSGYSEVVIVPDQDAEGIKKSKELAIFLAKMFPETKIFLCDLPFSEEERAATAKQI